MDLLKNTKIEFMNNYIQMKNKLVITASITAFITIVLSYIDNSFERLYMYFIGYVLLLGFFFITFMIVISLYSFLIGLTKTSKVTGYYIAAFLVIATSSTLYVLVINIFTQVTSFFDYTVVESDLDRFMTFISIVIASIVPIMLTLYTLRKSKEENLVNLRIQAMPFVNVYYDNEYNDYMSEYCDVKFEHDDFKKAPYEKVHYYIQNNSENIVRDINVVNIIPYLKNDEKVIMLDEIDNKIYHKDIKIGLCKQGKYYVRIEFPNMDSGIVYKYTDDNNVRDLTLGMHVKVEFVDKLYNKYYQVYDLLVYNKIASYGKGYFQISDFEYLEDVQE